VKVEDCTLQGFSPSFKMKLEDRALPFALPSCASALFSEPLSRKQTTRHFSLTRLVGLDDVNH
jgi:hypothetical protein